MRAIRVHTPGEADVMRYEEIPLPEPQAGEARVRIHAAGLNFVDIYQRMGRYPLPLPFTPGNEGAGVVDAVGEGVNEVRVGDRVGFAMHLGAYAEAVTVPAWQLVPLPPDVDVQTAAAVLLQGMTAHYLAYSTFPLKPGHTALVHAAAGGVGLLLVQIAKRRGARVIGTVSTEEKVQLAKAMGADHVILYTQTDFEAETKRLTDGKGVDVVYDSVGKTTFAKSLNCLKRRGMMVLYGQSSGPVAPIDPQILNAKGSLFLSRPGMRDYMAGRDELLQRAGDLFRWLATGELKVRIDKTFPLSDAAAAHRYMEERQTKGKVLLIP